MSKTFTFLVGLLAALGIALASICIDRHLFPRVNNPTTEQLVKLLAQSEEDYRVLVDEASKMYLQNVELRQRLMELNNGISPDFERSPFEG